MKNAFLKFVPYVLILAAVALLFIPKSIDYIDVEKFFADTDPYYQPAEHHLFKRTVAHEDYYYPGVQVGKLWRKIGIGRGLVAGERHRTPLRDNYLFGCSYTHYSACVLPYPQTREYALGAYKALRVSSASLTFPDYQYLLFRERGRSWVYFGHIDVFDNKRAEPVFKLLDNGLASVVSLAGMGSGYSTTFMQAYRLDGASPKLLLAVPNQASRQGIGLLNFQITSTFDYLNGVLVGNYRITFTAQPSGLSGGRVMPLFTALRRVAFRWNGKDLAFMPEASTIEPLEINRIVSGSYARIYTMFRSDFDKLAMAEGLKKAWFDEFLSIVREEGLEVKSQILVSAPALE